MDVQICLWAKNSDWFVLLASFTSKYMVLTWSIVGANPTPSRTRPVRSQSASDGIAARIAEDALQSSDGHNNHSMSPAVTLERNNVVRFDTGPSLATPKSPIEDTFDSQQSDVYRRVSTETKSEREIEDLPRNAKESLFAKLLNYKWKKEDIKDDGKDLC